MLVTPSSEDGGGGDGGRGDGSGNNDGELIGYSHPNPILDTGLYEVGFEDGRVATFAANIIAENVIGTKEQIDVHRSTYSTSRIYYY